MAVKQLTLWQHDITERACYVVNQILDEYVYMVPNTPDEIRGTRNDVLKMRKLVDYSIEDSKRATLLLKLLQQHNKWLYNDLCERGPKGKTGEYRRWIASTFCTIVNYQHMTNKLSCFAFTERKLLTVTLSAKAHEALGSKLDDFEMALQDGSIMDMITVVSRALDVIMIEGLLLPDEFFSVYNMNQTESERLYQLKQLLRSSELPQVAKDSIILILAVFNMHNFGVFESDPTKFLVGVMCI